MHIPLCYALTLISILNVTAGNSFQHSYYIILFISDLACFPEALIAGMKFTTRAQGDIQVIKILFEETLQ